MISYLPSRSSGALVGIWQVIQFLDAVYDRPIRARWAGPWKGCCLLKSLWALDGWIVWSSMATQDAPLLFFVRVIVAMVGRRERR